MSGSEQDNICHSCEKALIFSARQSGFLWSNGCSADPRIPRLASHKPIRRIGIDWHHSSEERAVRTWFYRISMEIWTRNALDINGISSDCSLLGIFVSFDSYAPRATIYAISSETAVFVVELWSVFETSLSNDELRAFTTVSCSRLGIPFNGLFVKGNEWFELRSTGPTTFSQCCQSREARAGARRDSTFGKPIIHLQYEQPPL